MSRNASVRFAAILSASLLVAPAAVQAQKALVYCPVGIDASGCNAIVTALNASPSPFPGGVDGGYDGSQGTVDLATADLSGYTVFVVPSLADGAGTQPYGLLRDATVAARLQAAFMGRVAVWSGTPDVGSTNRSAKDGLIRNLASWARPDSAGAHGPGVVTFQDNSDDAAARYGWLGSISSMSITADTTFEVYSNVQVLTSTGQTILTNSSGLQIGYSSMANSGLVASRAGVSSDATGGRTARVVLMTFEGDPSDPSIATVTTDREDYFPPDTVIITGAGWEPGETVRLLFQQDNNNPNVTRTTPADSAGHIHDQSFVIDSSHIGVRFTLTATGLSSGKTAQATFTDAKNVTVTKTGTGAGTVTNSQPLPANQINCGATCTGSFGNTDQVTLNVAVQAGSTIGAWTVPAAYTINSGCTTGNTSCQFTMNNTSQTVSIALTGATTTTTVVSSQNPSVFGQSVTFTATVSASGGTPTGTVTFKDGAATLGTGTLNGSGQATLSTSTLSVASHSITAVYAAVPGFLGSTSSVLTQTVNTASTTTSITSDNPDPSAAGAAVTVNYTVVANAPGSGTPTGSVTVSDGTDNCIGTVAAGSCTITLTTVGARTLTAIYGGDASFNGSSSAGAAHTVNQATSTTTLVSSVNPSVFGQSVVLTATVKNGATPITTGSITFIEGGTCASPGTTLQAAQTPNASGVVTYTSAALSVAAHSVTACYSGTASFTASNASLTQTVNKASTTTSITSDTPDPSSSGQAVTVNYAVAVTSPGAGTPTGNVTVTVSGGSESCTGTIAAGTCSITLTTIGARTLTATYAGDASFNTSASAGAAHQVNAAATTTAVASSLNPSTFGQSVTFTATVTSGGNPVTVGSVTFIEGGTCAAPTTTLQPATALNGSGQVTYTTGTLAGGSHTVTGCYGASGNFAASNGNVVQTVNAAASALAVSPATGTFQGTVALSATLTSGGNPVSGKSVAFTLNGTSVGSANTNASGVASIASASLGSINAGTYPTGVGASFAGDASVAASSGTAALTVNPKATTLTLTTVPASVVYGGSANFVAKLSENAGHTITFTVDGTTTVVGTDVTNNGGNASVTVNFASFPAIGAGPHTITATFAGETNFATSTDTKSFTVTKAAATVALSNLSQTYDGTPKSATVATTPAGLSTSVTYNGSATAPTNAASYAVVATVTDPNYTGTASGTLVIGKANQTITFAPLAAKTFGDAPFSVSATSTSGLAVTFAVGASDKCTIAGATVTLTGAGNCTVTASQAGDANYNAAAPVPQSFTIAPGAATVTLNGLSQTYDGTPRVVTATTTPAGLTVTITYDGSATAPTNAGSYAVVGTISDPNYTGSATGTLVVGKADQTITFAALTDKTFGDADFTVSATASSGLAVSFAASGSCTVTGNNVHLTGAGSCTITASQAGNSNYNAATDVARSFTIAKGAATLALSDLSHTFDGSPKSATVTTTPAGLTVVNVTYDASATAPTNAGSYAVVASLSNADYQATDATGTLTIAKAAQTIAFAPLANKTFGDAPFTVSATGGGSGNAVTFSSTTPTTCTVSGSTVTLEAAGGCTIAADQAGNANYEAATQVTQSFTIAKGAATLALSDLSHTYDGTPKSATVTTTPSGLTVVSVTYDASATAPTNAGSYAVVASLDNANYQATDATGTLVIAKATQTINFAALADKTFGDADFSVSATATSGLAVSFAASGKCTVTGSSVHLTGAGSCTLTASQAGNLNYEPATDVERTFTIAKASQTIVFAPLGNKTFGDAPFGLSATGGASGNAVVFASTTPGTCSVSSSTVTIEHAGSCTITANQAGNDDYNMAAEVSQSFTIAKAAATLTLSDLTHTYDGSPKAATVTVTPSGLSVVSVTYDGSATAPTNAGSYAVVASLTNNDYEATDATGTLVINKAAQAITFTQPSNTTFGDAPFALSASASSSLAVTFASTTPGTCSVSGDMVTIEHAGSCTVTANQAGNANYEAAPEVSRSFTISKAAATLALSNLTQTFDGSPRSATVTTTPSGLSGVSVTYDGSPTAPTNAGSYAVVASLTNNDYQATDATGTLVINKAAATLVLNGLTQTYDGSPRVVTATTTPSGLTVDITYDGAATAPTNAGSYAISATVNNPNYDGSTTGTLVVSKATQAIDFAALGNKTFGDAPFTLSASASSGLSVTFASTTAGTCSVAGSTVTIEHAGGCTITANQVGNANYEAAPEVSRSFTINKAAATLALSDLTHTYDGTPKSATVTTTPSGLTVVSVTYDGAATAPTNAGSYAVVASLTNDDYEATDATGTLVINKASQTITFAALADKTFGDPDFVLSASASSGLAVVFASTTPGTCSVAGSTVTIEHAGGCTITANQAGNTNYEAATEVSRSFTINKAPATLALGNLTQTYDGSPRSATVTTTPSGLGGVTVTYDGSPTAPTNAGSYAVVASLTNQDYVASDATGTLTINKAAATVVLNGLTQIYNGTPRVVTASTTPAGLTVDITYDGSPTAPTNAGSYAIAATVNDPNYEGSTTGTLVVNKADQTIAFAPLGDKTFGDPDFSVSATATSGLGVSFAATGKCTVSLDNVHLTGAGSCSIIASQAGDGNYNAAPDVTQSFSIAKASQTIAFAALADKTFGDAPFALSATGGASGNAVVFASTTPGTCSVSGTTATILHAGTCTITANQAGNDDYEAALEVSHSFTINKAPATLVLSNLTHTYSATPKSATVTTTPSGLSGVSVTYDGSTTSPTNAGSYAVVASLTNQDYQAPDASGTLVIGKAPLTITANDQTRVYGDPAVAFTVGYSGFVGSEGPGALGGTLAFTGTATTAVNVGDYVITPGGLTSSNYDIAFTGGALHITTRPVTVTADPKTKVYGEADPALTYQLTSGTLATGDAFIGALTRAAGETVASYAIQQGTLALTTNYALTYVGNSLVIGKKTLTVVADNKSKLYGASVPTLTGTLTGVVSGDNITASYLAGTGGLVTASTAVGQYPIIPVLADPDGKLANYDLTSTNGQLTITAAPLTVTADAKSRQYGASNPAFSASISGFVLGQNASTAGVTGAATFSGAGPSAGNSTPVGTYAITPAAGTLSAPNYTFLTANGASFVNGLLTITQATSTTVAAAASAPYSEVGQNVALTATVTGSTPPAVGEGTVKFTLKNGAVPIGSSVTVPVAAGAASATYAVPAMTDVGNYSILAEYTSGGNYTASNNTGTLTIQPANLEDETATTDADFKHVDGVDALFKKDGNLTTLRLQNTNPGTVHYQLTLRNITGVVIDAATGSTAKTILEVPAITSCGNVSCPAAVLNGPAWVLKAAKAVHVHPDDKTDDMPVQLSYKASGTCTDETGYVSTLTSIPASAPKCIRVTGYAIPKRERARLDVHLEFRWKDTGGWSSNPDSKLYFRSGFAFKSTTTVNFPVAPSIRTSVDAAGLIVAGQRVTAMGGFAFNSAGVPATGYKVRAFNLQTDASCTILDTDSKIVSQDVISLDGFYFIWKKGANQMDAGAVDLPSNVKYYLQLCNGVTPVTGHAVKNKLVDKEFDEEDFDLP